MYDENGRRISAEFNDADGTARGTANANGEYGENPASDIAVNDIGKVWYRTSLLNSTLFAVDANGAVVAHMIYDPWGQPLTETYIDTNRSGLDNLNNYTGYSWDETLGLYYAQNRFYDAADHRFTQEDIVKDGGNWYVYCGNNPTVFIDVYGLAVLPYPGFIHQAVLLHIKATHPNYLHEQKIDYDFLWGRADIISPDGQVWEIKSAGAVDTPAKLKRAQNQIDKYVVNTWHNYPLIPLKIGNDTINGSFNLYTRYVNYFVRYYCIGHGIVQYEYTYEFVPEQVLEDIGVVAMLGKAAVIFAFSGGTVLVPQPS